MTRTDGYAPIGSYAVLGDGRTAALVAPDGAVDWLCLPGMQDPAVFAALLDPDRGGAFTLAPRDSYEVRERRYVADSNVLETTYATSGGTVQVIDALNLREGRTLPWTELARRVEGVDGSVTLTWTLAPRFDFGRQAMRWRTRGGLPLAVAGPWAVSVIADGVEGIEQYGDTVRGTITTAPGSRHLVGMAGVHDAPIVLPDPEQVDERIDGTVEFWRQRANGVRYDGRWRDAVIRSALALQLLVSDDTGAIAAAATMALPERIGGDMNWDYRYQWVRDASFAMDALMGVGMQAQAHASFHALSRAMRHTHPRLQPMYTLLGSPELPNETLDLRGYRDSRPVLVGNGAAGQLQLDGWGDLLNTAVGYTRDGHLLDDATADDLADAVNLLCDLWTDDDSGIWELHGSQQPYTSSKMLCWTAVNHALELVDDDQVSDTQADRWRSVREQIRDFVEDRCWSDEVGSYTFYAGSDGLDVSVLLAARMNYWSRPDDPRLCATIDALRRELGAGPFLYRYSGAREKENAFVACGFWMVEALAITGQVDAAVAQMDDLVAACSDLGLLSEEIDPATRDLVGNTPQGLSHLSLINAALAIGRAGG